MIYFVVWVLLINSNVNPNPNPDKFGRITNLDYYSDVKILAPEVFVREFTDRTEAYDFLNECLKQNDIKNQCIDSIGARK